MAMPHLRAATRFSPRASRGYRLPMTAVPAGYRPPVPQSGGMSSTTTTPSAGGMMSQAATPAASSPFMQGGMSSTRLPQAAGVQGVMPGYADGGGVLPPDQRLSTNIDTGPSNWKDWFLYQKGNFDRTPLGQMANSLTGPDLSTPADKGSLQDQAGFNDIQTPQQTAQAQPDDNDDPDAVQGNPGDQNDNGQGALTGYDDPFEWQDYQPESSDQLQPMVNDAMSGANSYADGGAIPDDTEQTPETFGQTIKRGFSDADQNLNAGADDVLDTINKIFDFGRQKAGLGQLSTGSQSPKAQQNPTAFDDGGSVDDDDDNSSTGAIPDDAGADNGQPAQAQGIPQPSKIISYLMGADAAPPQVVAGLEQSIDPNGQMDPDTRHIEAIRQGAELGGPQGGWGVLQHYRQQYDARRAFAAAALNGVAGKPADITAAAQAATQAYSYVPDGTQISFQPGANGVTATVKRVGSQQPFAQAQLNPQQFNEFLRGRAGQFDNLMDNSGAQVLTQLQRSQGRPFGENPNAATGGQPSNMTGAQQFGGFAQPSAQPPRPIRGQVPGAPASPQQGRPLSDVDGAAWWERQNADESPLVRRSHQMFSIGQEPQRLRWLSEQEQQASENEIKDKAAGSRVEAAKATQEGAANRANIYSGSKERQNDETNKTRLQVVGQQAAQRDVASQREADQRLVTNWRTATGTSKQQPPPNVQAAIRRLNSNSYQSHQQAAPQQAAPQQAAPQNVPQAHSNTVPQQIIRNGRVWEKNPKDGLWYPKPH